ncbi:MAG TPA: diheme cytochrome c [Thiobacillaceae bacterium]|nr:diheme cytochrome c [Thiobacillaceae bacterium]HNA82853.1 diheme cytochrome c [Thiobacillaceae bacterium]HNF88902.1 diheme cytochrome c [Thiobacillaceae bacterium]HNH89412.1 diheme cytochrome c [Thiobacillaceae bacterium]HNI07848.1 diheme cytochrome c [Thiobacillaceae bacterium]
MKSVLFLIVLALGATTPARAMDRALCLPYPANAQYTEECGSCHVAYSPSLLPARSWRRIMAELDRHFESDASVEEPVRLALEHHLVEHASDNEDATCRMGMMNRMLAGETPLRITETPYFRRLHRPLGEQAWKHAKVGSPANCGACHPKAAEGRFLASEVRLPPPLKLAERRMGGCMEKRGRAN